MSSVFSKLAGFYHFAGTTKSCNYIWVRFKSVKTNIIPERSLIFRAIFRILVFEQTLPQFKINKSEICAHYAIEVTRDEKLLLKLARLPQIGAQIAH